MLADSEVGKIKKESPALLGAFYILHLTQRGKSNIYFKISIVCGDVYRAINQCGRWCSPSRRREAS